MVRDFAWLTPNALYGLVDYLTRMDVIHEISWMRAPADDPLPHLLLEPRNLSCTSGDGLLGRIVDVEKALGQRIYDNDQEVTLAVDDALCPWNQGTWQLRSESGRGIVKQCNQAPQLRMPVDTLAMLYFGQISATDAARMGRLTAVSDIALTAADQLFKTRYKPFCADIW